MKHRFSILRIAAAAVLAVTIAACSSTTSVHTSTPLATHGSPVTGDTIGGVNHPLNGYLQADKTYYMDSSVIIPIGDTLLIQQGVTVIMLNTGISNAAGSPEFQVYGTLICNGVSGDPIYLTVPANLRLYANLTNVNSNSLWGGIECAGPTTPGAPNGSGDLILKWTHIGFAGGSAAGTNDPIVGSGVNALCQVWFQTRSKNFIMEDSWITGSTDDPLRLFRRQHQLWLCAMSVAGAQALDDWGFQHEVRNSG